MVQHSMLWTTGVTGDGIVGYDMTQTTRMFDALHGEGVVTNFLNLLAVTGVASPISVNTGAAMIHGFFYDADGAEALIIATPLVGTTGFRVVVRADWTGHAAQAVTPPLYPATSKFTARLVVLRSADGDAAIPAATQTVNDLWDLTLATGTITTAGAITLTDARTYIDVVRLTAIADMLSITAHTALGNGAPHHAAVTLAASADAIMDLTGQAISLETQTANTVLAGPTTGAAAAPDFRALVAADLPANVMVDTKAAILASTATSGAVGFATDTLELYVADGSTWRKVPFALVPDTTSPDMGYLQDSSRIGYGTTYVTDKTLNNTVIGSNGTASNGGVRVTTAGVFQVYLNGSWNTVVTNFVLREGATFGYTFEHQPIGFTTYLEIMTGQSLSNLGLNGLPITNAYKTSMGAYPPSAVLGGRSIT